MGNDQMCSGSAKFQLWDGSIRIIENIRLVLELRTNLPSLGMFDSNGCWYKFENGTLKVMKGSLVMVLKGFLQQGLYVLQGKAITRVKATAKMQDETRLLHRRLGHMSVKGLQELCKQGILNSKLISSLDFCESYILGKAHKLKFTKSTHTSSNILEYIHSDL